MEFVVWWFNYPGLLLILRLDSPVHQVEMVTLLCFALVSTGDFELSQLSCLSSSVGRASCMRHRFAFHLILWKKLSQVLCCVVLCVELCCVVLLCLSYSLFDCLSNHVFTRHSRNQSTLKYQHQLQCTVLRTDKLYNTITARCA